MEPQSSVQEGVPVQHGVASGVSQLREEGGDRAGFVLAWFVSRGLPALFSCSCCIYDLL